MVLTTKDKKSIFYDTTTLTQVVMYLLAGLVRCGERDEEFANDTTDLISKINTNVCRTLDISEKDMKDVLLESAKMVTQTSTNKDAEHEFMMIKDMLSSKGAKA